jgi:hypothetical protein
VQRELNAILAAIAGFIASIGILALVIWVIAGFIGWLSGGLL